MTRSPGAGNSPFGRWTAASSPRSLLRSHVSSIGYHIVKQASPDEVCAVLAMVFWFVAVVLGEGVLGHAFSSHQELVGVAGVALPFVGAGIGLFALESERARGLGLIAISLNSLLFILRMGGCGGLMVSH
jgi:hypothetical protein